MLLFPLAGSYEQIHSPFSPERLLFSKLPSMFVFSLEGLMYPTRDIVTKKVFTELAIQIISVHFVLHTAGFPPFFLWLIYERPAIWLSEFSLWFFKINHAL